MKYYHSSPKKFKPNDIIGRHDMPVYMTQSPVPHYTIYERALAENWNVYEVVPLSKITIGKCWDEAITTQVQIVSRVGNARGIANNAQKHFKPHDWKSIPGSQVFWKKHVNMRIR